MNTSYPPWSLCYASYVPVRSLMRECGLSTAFRLSGVEEKSKSLFCMSITDEREGGRERDRGSQTEKVRERESETETERARQTQRET